MLKMDWDENMIDIHTNKVNYKKKDKYTYEFNIIIN